MLCHVLGGLPRALVTAICKHQAYTLRDMGCMRDDLQNSNSTKQKKRESATERVSDVEQHEREKDSLYSNP